MKKEKVFLLSTTEGCATNLMENATYRQMLERSEFSNVYDVNEADVVIINTCAYTNNQEKKSLDMIEYFQKKYPEKKIIVGGCLTKINSKKLQSIYQGETFFPGDVQQLKRTLKIENTSNDKDITAHFFDKNDFGRLTLNHRMVLFLRFVFFKMEDLFQKKIQPLHNVLKTAIVNDEYYGISVSQGCAGHCTFCSIKQAKGHVRSKPLAQISYELEKGFQLGKNKIWLLGDDIGCYGIDLQLTIVNLLEEILKVDNNFELVINYFEPYFLLQHYEKLAVLFRDERILHVNFPIQSGNFRVIQDMGRNYDPFLVLQKIKELKKIRPNLVFKTNIIVGFPGETWGDFFDSLKSVFYFDTILALKFTAREGTRAYKMEAQVSEFVKRTRLFIINIIIFVRHFYIVMKSFMNIKI